MPERNLKYSTDVCNLYDIESRKKAAYIASKGGAIGVVNRGVCALWGNGQNSDFVNRIATIKGEERKNRPLAATFSTERLLELLDTSKIPQSMYELFSDSDRLVARTASLCFFRVPILESPTYDLPPSMYMRREDGTPIIQNWDPLGHKQTCLLLEEFINEGIMYPAVTSMNISGQPEIVDSREGIQFAQEHDIPLFLDDNKPNLGVKGSYTIFNLDERGLTLIRDGNIPAKLFYQLLDLNESDIDTQNYKMPKYQQLEFPNRLLEGLTPCQARKAILVYMRGKYEASDINRVVKLV